MDTNEEELGQYNETYGKDMEKLHDTIKETLAELSPETVILDSPNYADAIVGLDDSNRLVYDYDKMIEHLMVLDGMTMEEAIEFIDYNTVRALPYAGPMAPVIVYPLPI